MNLSAAPKHFLDLWSLSAAELRALLDTAHARKAARRDWPKAKPDADRPLDGRMLAMIFEKHSTRTRASFDVAMRQLGGQTAVYGASDLQLGRGETIEDTARVLSRMVDAIMLRAKSHDTLLALAAASDAPVLNGLTNRSHPCQILAALMTFEERRGPLAGRKLAWLGDANNVCASFLHAAPLAGYAFAIACPPQYAPKAEDLARAGAAVVTVTDDPAAAVVGADMVITDAWVSMGDEDEAERKAALAPYQVTTALMGKAAARAIFSHCLPAHRGEEVAAEVIDGPASSVFDEAENRIHAQKAALLYCLADLP